MIKFQDVARDSSEFLSMTGYAPDEFNALPPWLKESPAESKYAPEGKERANKTAACRNSPFPAPEDKLFFILTRFKQHPAQSMQGISFGIALPKANQRIHFLAPVLQSALSKPGQAPGRNMEEFSPQNFRIFAHDGAERPVQRPADCAEQKNTIAGNKKDIRLKTTYQRTLYARRFA